MNARIVIIGPHGVGKTSVAQSLTQLSSGQLRYSIERIITSRSRRAGEDDSEYEFVSASDFLSHEQEYLYVQPNRGVAWRYALAADRPLGVQEARIYNVVPETATFIKQRFDDELVIICGLLPNNIADLRDRMLNRDQQIGEDELHVRLSYAENDVEAVRNMADVIQVSYGDVEMVTRQLHEKIIKYIEGKRS